MQTRAPGSRSKGTRRKRPPLPVTSRSARHRSRALFLATLLSLWRWPTFGATIYEFEVIARTGAPIAGMPTASLGSGPSINDAGKVAFVARDRQGGLGSVLLKAADVVERNVPMIDPFTVGNNVQVNNNDQIVWQEESGDGLVTYVIRLDTPTSGQIIATGSRTIWVESPFDEVLLWATINNAGRVVFGADMNLTDNTVLGTRTTGTGPYTVSPILRGFPNLFPMLADNDTTVVRWGGDVLSPIVRITDANLDTANFITESPAFVAVGEKPGISDDGLVVAFVGHHETQGLGVFVSRFFNDFTPVKIAGVPGDGTVSPPEAFVDRNGNGAYDSGEEDLGFFSNFTLEPRFGVNAAGGVEEKVYTVAFIAFGLASPGQTGPVGLYTMRVHIDSLVVTEPTLVTEVGRKLADLPGTVADIRLYDPLNSRGQVAFWVSTSTGAQAIIRATPRTLRCKVQWQNGQPIQGAVIEPYYFRENDLQIETFLIAPEDVVKSGPDGTFELPPQLTDAPPQPWEYEPGKYRGIRAKVSVTEITRDGDLNREGTDDVQIVTNYPDWDPMRPFKKPTTCPLTITFPYPVFFQAGVTGQVNDYSADGRLRAFLTLDSGATRLELLGLTLGTSLDLDELTYWQAVKTGMDDDPRVPAFLYFGMPSGPPPPGDLLCAWVPNDGVSWGYNNCIIQSPRYVNDSGDRINEHFEKRVLPQIKRYTPVGQVPFNIVAHSLGGVITRNWLARLNTKAPLARYVTFDSPHGGVMLSNLLIGNFWSEHFMNGLALLPLTPPPPPLRGWNYYRRMPSRESHLLFLAPNDLVITPEGPPGSAFGVGRIMLAPLEAWMMLVPSGYCERFIGGWLLPAYHEEHGIQNVSRTFISAARFLASGTRPVLENHVLGLPPFFVADYGSGPVGPCPLPVKAAGTSSLRCDLQAQAGATADEPLYSDTEGSLKLLGFVSQAAARIQVLDSDGNQIPPVNEAVSPLGSAGYTFAFDVPVTPGAQTLRLVSGATAAAALVTVLQPTVMTCGVGSSPILCAPTDQVGIRASILDEGGSPVMGKSAEAHVVVTTPADERVEIELSDDGAHGDGAANDGIYGAFFNETAECGRYGLSADMTIELPSGALARRQGEGMFVVQSQAARFTGVTSERPVDEDANGRMDAIDVDFDVAVAQNGEYALSSGILANGSAVGTLRTVFAVASAPSVHTATLRIPREVFLDHAVSTSLVLSAPELSDNGQCLFLDSIPDYSTQIYSLDGFDPPPPPVITFVVPSFGGVEGGYEVLMEGAELARVTQVYFGDQRAEQFLIHGKATLSVMVPPWDGQNQQAALRLVTPWGERMEEDLFEYVAGFQPTFFARGDPNADGMVDLSDAVAILLYLFAGRRPPSCLKSADVNDDGAVNVSDSIFCLSYLFAGGGPPPNPFPECAVDPSPDALSCERHEPCLVTDAGD